MKHQHKKHFGQNFLRSQRVIDQIIGVINPKPTDHIVEIGPGLGALTDQLVTQSKRLDVIEIDEELIPKLLASFSIYPGFHLHQTDALSFDFSPLGSALRVVGNLPYNISTPLLFHLLSFRDRIVDMHFMLQKEVVERLAAPVGSGDYGRLSVMFQYYCQVEDLFLVGPENFFPAPQVDSKIVRLIPYQQKSHCADNEGLFADLVKMAFAHRRKTMRNNLKALLKTQPELDQQFDLTRRPQEFAVAEFVALANKLNDN